jgi:hypothetical protein
MGIQGASRHAETLAAAMSDCRLVVSRVRSVEGCVHLWKKITVL